MKVAFVIAGVVCIFLSGCLECQCDADSTSCSLNSKPAGATMLRHVVLFSFKEGASDADIRAIVDAFRALPSKIPQIKGFEWGADVSAENLAQGYTHCFFVTFRDEQGRDAYLPHPDHKAFGELIGPHLEKVLVIDYWARK